jgi:hypothetical protein
VQLRHPLLLSGASVVVSPCNHLDSVESVFRKVTENILPVLVYTIADENLSPRELRELQEIRQLVGNFPVFFVRVAPPSSSSTWELTESQQHEMMSSGGAGGRVAGARRRSSTTGESNSRAGSFSDESVSSGDTHGSWNVPPSPPESESAPSTIHAQLTKLGTPCPCSPLSETTG